VRRILTSVVLASVLHSSAAQAAALTAGTIRSLHINLESGIAHVLFAGSPTINEPGCSVPWTGNLLTDEQFMKYVWPMLLAAKASGLPVSISTSGCTGGYPKIVAVDFEPR
jgi:hypothetical protein